MESKKINGGDYFGGMFGAHMKGCLKAIELNPELVIGYDLDSGYPYVRTKEDQQNEIDMWESLKVKSNLKPIGKLFIFGTGGAIDKNK